MALACLHRYPFLRLLLPLIVGILCGDWLFFQGVHIPWAGFSFLLASLSLLLMITYFPNRFSTRWLFGTVVLLLCLVAGGGWTNLRLQQTVCSFPKSEAVYRILLTEKPEMKERSYLCRAQLIERRDSSSVFPLNRQAVLYFAKDSAACRLQCGDELLISARISPPVNNGNPDEFDYVRYLTHQSVSGTGFIAAGNWQVTTHDVLHSLRRTALSYREKILSFYRRLGFKEEPFAVLSALTVGYKEELSEEIRETYSVSGASHVLALSGLHIGFLYALLLFCLKGVPGQSKAILLLRAAVIIASLWAFAFFTGLSPSVVRSVIMFTLLALAEATTRKRISLNTLSVAAFAMLIYNPNWLFDVGFQLSFCAVAAILLIYPWLYRQLPVGSWPARKVWGLMSVSIAAQIGVAPLVLIYFSRFSTHFLLTNLLVIPLVSLIMYAAVVMLLATPFPAIQSAVAVGVQWLVDWLNTSVRWVEQLPWASVDGIWIDRVEVLCFYLSVLLLMYHVVKRSGKSLLAFGCCVLFAGSYHLVALINDRPQRSIVFYNVRGCPVVHCLAADGRSWLAYADSVPDEKRLLRVASGYWNHCRLSPPVRVVSDYSSPSFSVRNHILCFGESRVCLLNDARWRNKRASRPLSIDYLYLCKGYGGRLEELAELFTFRKVVLDTSLPDGRKKAFIEECRRLGIHFISLSDEGSVRFLP